MLVKYSFGSLGQSSNPAAAKKGPRRNDCAGTPKISRAAGQTSGSRGVSLELHLFLTDNGDLLVSFVLGLECGWTNLGSNVELHP